METLLRLLQDGKSRTLEMLAAELHTSVDHVKRDIEFLEQAGVIRRIEFPGGENAENAGSTGISPGFCGGCTVGNGSGSKTGHSCGSCTACGSGGKTCASCMPEGGFRNMGVMWEVVD